MAGVWSAQERWLVTLHHFLAQLSEKKNDTIEYSSETVMLTVSTRVLFLVESKQTKAKTICYLKSPEMQ